MVGSNIITKSNYTLVTYFAPFAFYNVNVINTTTWLHVESEISLFQSVKSERPNNYCCLKNLEVLHQSQDVSLKALKLFFFSETRLSTRRMIIKVCS